MSIRTDAFAFRTISLLIAFLLLASTGQAQANRIPSQIEARGRTTLAHHVPRLPEITRDLGPVEPNFRLDSMIVLLKLSQAQEEDSQRLLAEQQDPSSPLYHHWLTPEEYADRFGLSNDDIQKLTTWLESFGFRVEHVAKGRDWIRFSGTAGQVERALRTKIYRYRENDEVHFANISNPTIPSGLVNIVRAVDGLHDFRPKPHQVQIATQNTAFPGHPLSPDDIATIYGLKPFYDAGIDGNGVKLAVVGQTDMGTTDVINFQAMFQLTPNNFQTLTYGPDPGVRAEDVMEASLDLEWAGAVAPRATILYVNSTNVFDSLREAIDNDLAPIITMSYGGCEQNFAAVAADSQQLVQKANLFGITVVVASGDSGAASCDWGVASATHGLAVSFPASVPEVTAVGGTELSESSSFPAYSYVPEIAWNDTFLQGTLAAGGGGASLLYPKPAWQTGPGVPADNARDVPDVALTSSASHDPYLSCLNNSCSYSRYSLAGGTSVAAPVFAGILALINQYQIVHQFNAQPGLGNINPILYKLAQHTPSVFHDITTGTNRVPCLLGSPDCSSGTIGYSAGPGYDQVTGLGSINAFGLAGAWNNYLATVTVKLASGCIGWGAGAGTTATALVKAITGNQTPTGTVTFFSSTGDTLGSATLSGSSATAFASISISANIAFYGDFIHIYAVYEGDNNFQRSVSPNVTLMREGYGNATNISLQVLPSVIPQGGRAGFIATVQSLSPYCGTPTGSVKLSFGGSEANGSSADGLTLATGALNSSGIAVMTAVVPGSGTVPILATYSGDGNFQTATTVRPQTVAVIPSNSPNFSRTSGPFDASRFVPVLPCRVADTRLPAGPYGGPAIEGQTTRDFVIPGSPCGIPSTAIAYSLNVTVVPHGPLRWVTVWPTGQARPFVSNLNSTDGRIKANAAIVPAGIAGAVSVFATNDTEVVLDISGYFVPAVDGTGLAFYPLPPCRVVDTRYAGGLFGGPSLIAGQEREFPMHNSACPLPPWAQAYAVNFTAIPHSPLRYLTVWPTGYTRPFVSTLNAPTGTVTANAALVPAGQDGGINVFATEDTDLLVDINGYFGPASTGGLSLYSWPPCRLIDTRETPTAQPFGGTLTISGNSCNLPATAQFFVASATVVPLNPLVFLTLWADTGTQPNVSTLNAWDAMVTSNLAIVPTVNGSIDAFASDPTHLILDIFGYFAP